MIAFPAALAVLLAAGLQHPDSGAATHDSLVQLARDRPDSVREALRHHFAAGREGDLVAAEHLAAAYAVAWQDSFLVRQVARFGALTPSDRLAKVAADSVRRAGNDALRRDGVDAALRLWRESLRRFEALGDSAALGAALGNIGAAFYIAGRLDSAELYLARSRAVAEAVGDVRTAANAIGTLGSVSLDRGDLVRAQVFYTRAGALRPRSGDVRGEAADRNNLGLIAQTLGDLDGARGQFEQALVLNRRSGRPDAAATNLVNLGNIASATGEYAAAEARYREALALYRADGSRPDAAFALRSLGLLALRRGDYRAARGDLAEALAIYLATGPAMEIIALRRDLANTLGAMGDIQGAVRELRLAEQLAMGRDIPPVVRAKLALSRGDLAVQLNTYVEADRQYARAIDLYRRAGETAGRAQAQQGRGLLLLLREDYRGAAQQLGLALQAQEEAGDRRSMAVTRLYLARVARARGDTAEARRTLERALVGLRQTSDPVVEAAVLTALGELDTDTGLSLAAESLFAQGRDRLARHAAPEISWQLHASWATALERRGAVGDAARELAAAVTEVEQVSATLPLEERRAAYRADKWDVYARLAMLQRTLGRDAAALETSERLRARQMLDLLARGRVDTGGPASPALLAQEQDLRRRITLLTRQLEGAGSDEDGTREPALEEAGAGATREVLARAQERYGELLLEMREARPDYSALVSAAVASSGEVMAALAPDEALLEYLVGDSTTLVFVVTRDSLNALDLDVTHRELAGLVDFVRSTLVRPDSGVTRTTWRAPLGRLYEDLLAPVERAGLLQGKRRLLITPHAELHYLPFAALRQRDGRFLVERYELTTIPSASVWLRLRGRPAASGAGGVLALAPRVDALPGSRVEVANIRRLYGNGARILIGAAASERAFREAAPREAIIHLASYGVLNKHNPLFSFVQLAGGAGAGDDGRLEVHEVFGLDLHARLVVLSACQTALGSGALADVPPGDDWVGLVRAFLNAGADNVLATLWPVEDRATAGLMAEFYTGLRAGSSESQALAAAQRRLLADPRTANPFYWAGFALVGAR